MEDYTYEITMIKNIGIIIIGIAFTIIVYTTVDYFRERRKTK
jgi:hypothetical protein